MDETKPNWSGDVLCACCGEPWDRWGAHHGDMSDTEYTAFLAGEGCPSCLAKVPRLKLRSLDVGFDLRTTRHPVVLPSSGAMIAEVLDEDDQPTTVFGSRRAVCRKLRTLGYEVNLKSEVEVLTRRITAYSELLDLIIRELSALQTERTDVLVKRIIALKTGLDTV